MTQGNWSIWFSIPDGSVFTTPDVGPEFLVLGHEDVECALCASLQLAPFVFSAIDHPLGFLA
jgi:hypothetical protein